MAATPKWACAALVVAMSAAACAAVVPEVWSGKADEAALDKAWHELPAPVRPAVDFQKVLVKIRASNKPDEWRGEVERFAKAPETDAMSAGLRELAKCWMARAEMVRVDEALRLYFRKAVRFPDTLGAVEKDLPPGAKLDPWGEPWIYQATAPKEMAKWTKQRYALGPTRAPLLTPLAEAVKAKPAPVGWKLSPRDAGGVRALEMRGADGKVAVVQAGGRFGDATLLFVGEGWALLADTERLFALGF